MKSVAAFQFSLVQKCLPHDSYHSPGTIALDSMEGAVGEFLPPKRKKKDGVTTNFHSAGSKEPVLCYNVYI